MLYLVASLIIIAALSINHYTSRYKDAKTTKAIQNTIVTSASFLASWSILDSFLIPGNWWTLNSQNLGIVIVISLILVTINVVLYRWYTKGKDYAPLQRAGVITDGCPYTGNWSVPANFITHGAQVIWEEIIFRGLLGIVLYLWFGPVVAIIVPTALFGLAHYLPFRVFAVKHGIKPDRYVWGSLISTTVFPAAFIIANLAFHSLIPGWIMHWFLNCSVGLYLRYLQPTSQNTVSYASRS